MELVSGIITTHNRTVSILRRAIDSILNQTYPNIEIIVVDDSTDDFSERGAIEEMVLSLADKNVRYIKQKCAGACAARNNGLSASNGEIVGFLDDDDEWLPEKVEKMLPLFKNPDVALVHSAWILKRDDTGELIDKYPEFHHENVYDVLMHGNNYIGSTSFPLLRKSALLDIGGFDVLQPSAQDLDVWLRLSKKYKVDFVKEPLSLYHYHLEEKITGNHTKRINGWKRIIEKNMDYLKAHPEAYYNKMYRLAIVYGKNSELCSALGLWVKCCVKRPLKVKSNVSMFFEILGEKVKSKREK